VRSTSWKNIGKGTVDRSWHLSWTGYSGGNGVGAAYTLTGGQKFSDDFHTFAVEWEPNVIALLCRWTLVQDAHPGRSARRHTWVFDHPFFIIEVAVGGGFPGIPMHQQFFPQQMLVDYVRVYQRATPKRARVVY
jgi:beta-glucanase (GH16 family)